MAKSISFQSRNRDSEGSSNAAVLPPDSELLVKQMRGEYRVKSPGLQPLWDEARRLAREIGEVRFEHVRRELNKEADRLANEAMDEASRAT